MRELARCLAWALAIGAAALLVALLASRGLAQADGAAAWAVFLAFWPFYLLGHAFQGDVAPGSGQARMDAAVFAAQFAYFFVAVVLLRYLWRRRKRQ